MLFIYEDIDVPIICLLIIKYLWNYHSSIYRSINHLLIYQPFLYVSSVYHLSTYQPITYLMSIIYWLIIYLSIISTIKDRDTIFFFTIYLYHQNWKTCFKGEVDWRFFTMGLVKPTDFTNYSYYFVTLLLWPNAVPQRTPRCNSGVVTEFPSAVFSANVHSHVFQFSDLVLGSHYFPLAPWMIDRFGRVTSADSTLGQSLGICPLLLSPGLSLSLLYYKGL